MFDWEEKLFLCFKAAYEFVKVRPERRRQESVRATLKDMRSPLLLFARMVSGKPVSLLETDSLHLCGEDRVFLPREFHEASAPMANVEFYWLKTALAAIALRDGISDLTELQAQARKEFPHWEERELALDALLPAPFFDFIEPGLTRATDDEARRFETVDPNEAQIAEAEGVTEIEGKGQAEVEVSLAPDDPGDGADLPIHTFEKIETLDEARGQQRKTDDEDELEEHQEALEALDMHQLWRSQERPRSIYRSELILDGLGLEVKDQRYQGVPYPEWDYRKRRYVEDWCYVLEEHRTVQEGGWAQRIAMEQRSLIRRLRAETASLITQWTKKRSQPVGAEFDLDALVRAEIDRRCGRVPDESIYVDRQRDQHDLAVMFLLDESYSTDSWIDNRRILDVITTTLFCAMEALHDHVDRLAVASFSSNTRRSCAFSLLKDFGETWQAKADALGEMKPRGYTRIGPALRHAQELMAQEKASRRLIVLVTDGRPGDYDRYEGEYGIQDVKKAIETGKRNGIETHAFAIETQANETFPRMFRRDHFDVIPRAEGLSKRLCKVVARQIIR